MAEGRRRSSVGLMWDALLARPIGAVRMNIDLSPLEVDLLVSYQLSLPRPSELGPAAFYAAKVVSKETLSARIREALIKSEILTPSADRGEVGLTLDTAKITRHFANQLPFCSAHVLRRVVSLLFVFEEQIVRWRMLDQEEGELRELLRTLPEGLEAELAIRLQAVSQKRRLLPSQYQSAERDYAVEELPSYSRR